MRKALLSAAAAAALALTLTACSSHGEMMTGSGDPGDVMFAQMMIPHHEQAVEMSDIALARSTDPEITELAQEIRDAQQPEIDQMKAWLGEWGVPVMTDHSDHAMAGMLSDEEIAELGTLSGDAFDRAFLEGMIAHHEGALVMAESVRDSADPDVQELAEAIVITQTAEIEQMRQMLG
jgi:uncharacterized protein (DUF305 family)